MAIRHALAVLGIPTALDFWVGLFEVPSQARYAFNTEFVSTLACFQYYFFVKSEAYTSYCPTALHQHLLASLVILLSTSLEMLILSYLFSKGWWLWGLLLMLLVAGLTVGWLIRWYKSSGGQAEASSR